MTNLEITERALLKIADTLTEESERYREEERWHLLKDRELERTLIYAAINTVRIRINHARAAK